MPSSLRLLSCSDLTSTLLSGFQFCRAWWVLWRVKIDWSHSSPPSPQPYVYALRSSGSTMGLLTPFPRDRAAYFSTYTGKYGGGTHPEGWRRDLTAMPLFFSRLIHFRCPSHASLSTLVVVHLHYTVIWPHGCSWRCWRQFHAFPLYWLQF